MKKHFCVAFIALAVLALTSCGKVWNTDLDSAKKQAAKQNKDIYLLFSGDDWTDYSADFKKNIVNTKEFEKTYGKKYVFVNVDISNEEFTRSTLTPEAGKKEYKEALRLKEIYKVKDALCTDYDVQTFPAVYILSCEGFVLARVGFNPEVKTVEEYRLLLEGYNQQIYESKKLVMAVRNSKGVEKAFAVDTLVAQTEPGFLNTLRPLVEQFEVFDPSDETKLNGKYDLYSAFYKAAEANKNGGDMASPFEEAIAKGRMDPETVQFAYYNAGSFLAASGNTDYDRILDLLTKAYAASPHSDFVPQVERVMEAAESIMKVYESNSALQDN